MMFIYELEVHDGRIFRVSVTNKSQIARLFGIVDTKNSGDFKVFRRFQCVQNGIHTLKQFEEIASDLN